MSVSENNVRTVELLLGIAKFYKARRYLTRKQEIIVEFNVTGGLPNFKNMVLECNMIEQMQTELDKIKEQ